MESDTHHPAHAGAHTCPVCSKDFASAEALTHHKAAKHEQPAKSHPKSRKSTVLSVILIVILVIGLGIYAYNASAKNYDALAQCIASSGAKFYGAFWCPHCQDQKKWFGNSKAYLPYVECSTDDGKGQLPVCDSANISGYPTWIFADGTRMSGALTLQQLGDKTGCTVPK